jgi:hypothetical protein
MVSSPIDSVRIKTMISPPIVSPVSIEMMPATSRISDRGSSSRCRIARIAPSMRGGASLFRPKRARRSEAPAAVSPVSPQPSRLESWSDERRQKDLSAGSNDGGTGFLKMEAASTVTAIEPYGDDSKPLTHWTRRQVDACQFRRKPGGPGHRGISGGRSLNISGFSGDIKGLKLVLSL